MLVDVGGRKGGKCVEVETVHLAEEV